MKNILLTILLMALGTVSAQAKAVKTPTANQLAKFYAEGEMDSGFYPAVTEFNTIKNVESNENKVITNYEIDLTNSVGGSDLLKTKEDYKKFAKSFQQKALKIQIKKYCEGHNIKKYLKKGVNFKSAIFWKNEGSNRSSFYPVLTNVDYATCVENGYFN